MLPLLEREVVDNHHWATEEELIDYYSIGQMTPGIIAINVSTIIGYNERGVLGAVLCAIAFLTPAFAIIGALATVILANAEVPIVKHAFAGVRIAVCALMGRTIHKMIQRGVVDKLTLLIFILAFVMIGLLSISPIPVTILAAACGVLAGRMKL